MTYLRLICRTEKLNDMDHRILSDCQALGVDLLKRNAQAYWKDERCTEVNYEFSSSIDFEQWYQFFSLVFGADNNTVEQDGREITHAGSPVLNDAEAFAYLFTEKQS